MDIRIESTQLKKQAKTSLIVGVFKGGQLLGTAKEIDKLSQGYLTRLFKERAFEGKIGSYLPLFHLANTAFEHILLVGCGDIKELSSPRFRKIVVGAIKCLSTFNRSTATCYLSELPIEDKSMAWKVKQIAEAAPEGIYCFDQFKSKKKPGSLKELIIHLPSADDLTAGKIALKQGKAIAEGVAFAKNLANTPSNVCTPAFLAKEARHLAATFPAISIKVLEEAEMKKQGMGALLAVSQGSAEKVKLICLEYKGTRKKQAPIVLIGKGVTFDTGGNSLKPAENMVGMKYDMCGASTVLGTLQAAAALRLPLHVMGIIPAVENMPGGRAYKPEDIVTSLSGQTIEVISTDAEGRLILADALTYCERYQPDVVIDIATLTGAVVIALGFHASALLSNYAPLEKALLKAGEDSNDRAWAFPLWEEYQDQIKSSFADMANVGGRPAGVITAACFLSRFTTPFRWAHLDVAGTAAMMIGTNERYATGRPIPLLMQYLINRCEPHA